MLRFATLLALARSSAAWSCPQLRVGEPFAPTNPVGAVCVVSEGLPRGKVIKVEATAREAGWERQPVCLRVQALTRPNTVREQFACGDASSVSITLMEPNEPHTYVILPQLKGQQDGVGVPAMRFSAVEEDASPSPPPRPSPSPPRPVSDKFGRSPPSLPLWPPNDSDCDAAEINTINACQPEVERWCANKVGNKINVLNCLIQYRNEASFYCQKSIDILDNCIYTPHLLIPMEIASMLLLATASIVLLCTLLRCCCRYVCIAPIQIGDDMSTIHDDELSDEDESVGSVTPLPSGVKMMEPSVAEQQMEDELPAYTEVVAGAAVARSSSPPPSSQIQL